MLVQLPSVVLDSVVEQTDDPDVAVLINRIPEPDETGVPLLDPIELEIYRPNGAPAQNELTITVDGIIVFDADIALAGWTVTTDLLGDDNACRRVVLQHDEVLRSDSEIVVRVEASSVGLDESYSFRSFDLVQPELVSVVARSKYTVRVQFSEAMQQQDPESVYDALNAANYSIERVSLPAVELQIVRVEPVSETEVDLVLDIEATYGAGYELSVINTRDLAGNSIVASPDNILPFTGFVPMYPAGRRFLLSDAIPAMNLAEDRTGDLRKFLSICQELTNVELSSIDEWTDILDPDVAPAEFVEAMLQDLGNPFEFDLSLIDKRRLIRVLVPIYQLKGTSPGVISAIQFFVGVPVTVETYGNAGWELTEEGFELDGDELNEETLGDPEASLGPDLYGLYSFRVVSPVDLSPAQRQTVDVIANYMRGEREHYLGTIEPSLPDPTLGTLDPFNPLVPLDHVELDFSSLGDGGSSGDFELH